MLWLHVISYIALALVVTGLLTALFGSSPTYRVDKRRDAFEGIDSPGFLNMIESLTDAKLNMHTGAEILSNGENFYPAEMEAIAGAQQSVNLEAYIFQKGRVSAEMVRVMAERARAGVKVKVLVDGIGAFSVGENYFRELIEAGGKVEWYHPFSIKSLFRMNNRTHRELLVVDGRIGFIGGAGIADNWRYAKNEQEPRWRDTVARVEGDVATNLQAVFAENWIETSGEIIAGDEYFPDDSASAGHTCAMVVGGSPSAGGSTRVRVLFQLLVASARESLHITTPYFLPDRSLRRELVRAIQRGVEVKVIVPGVKADHLMTRTSSRMLYGDVLKAGGSIYEYEKSMIHAKVMIVDGKWTVMGSTNCDFRSFGLNDEVNIAFVSPEVAARLQEDFAKDLTQCKLVQYEQWKRRPFYEHMMEWSGWVLRKQQ